MTETGEGSNGPSRLGERLQNLGQRLGQEYNNRFVRFPESEESRQWREKLANASENAWAEAQKETDAKMQRMGLTETQVGRREELIVNDEEPYNVIVPRSPGNLEGYKLFDRELAPGVTPPRSAESHDYRSRDERVGDLINELEDLSPGLSAPDKVAGIVERWGDEVTLGAESFLRHRNPHLKYFLTKEVGELYDYIGVLEHKLYPDRQLPVNARPVQENLPEGPEATSLLDNYIQSQRHVAQVAAEIATADPKRRRELGRELRRASQRRDKISEGVSKWRDFKEESRKMEGKLPANLFKETNERFGWERPDAQNYQLVKATHPDSGRDAHFLYYWKGGDKNRVFIEPVDRFGISLGDSEELAEAATSDEADQIVTQHAVGLRSLGWNVLGEVPLPVNPKEYRQTAHEVGLEQKAGRVQELSPLAQQYIENVIRREPSFEERLKPIAIEARAEIEDFWQWLKSGEVIRLVGEGRKKIALGLKEGMRNLRDRLKGRTDQSAKSAAGLMEPLEQRVNGLDGSVENQSKEAPVEVPQNTT